MTEIEIRAVAADERRAAADAFRAALLAGAVNDEMLADGQASWDDSDSLAAWDGDRCVGSVGAFHFDSTVPGGARVRTAGVTRVGVLPTHTRRGLLTRMMHRLLEEARSRGDVLATLHASETAIYRRFGFGLATDTAAVAIEPRAATPWRLPAPTGTVRLLAPDEVQGTVPPLYERVARWRVGSISRPAWMWERRLAAASGPAESLHGKGTFVAVHADPMGIDDGYVVYEVEWDEGFARDPVGAGVVRDLWGAAPATEIELWRFVIGVDLVVRWTAPARPVDEPVRRAMHDARAYETRQRIDEQWVRVLDVDAALGSRTYGPAADPVVVGVTDPVFARNTGTWSVSADGAARSREPADVEIDVAALGDVYLGGVSWHQLTATGAVRADPVVVDRLDALFGVAPAPFCGTMY